MDKQLRTWRAAADALVTEGSFRWDAAAELLAAIVRASRVPALTDIARQVLPSVRAAASATSDPFGRSVARHRFEAVRHHLSATASVPFGRRAQPTPASRTESRAAPQDIPERRLLGLPSHGRLTGTAIRDAYRRAVRTAHPDNGGDVESFLAIVAARDTLLAQLSGDPDPE